MRPAAEQAGLGKVLVLALGTFATGTDAFIIAGLVPAVAGALHTSVAAAGQMVTVFALVYAVGSPLITTALANLPRRAVLIGALLCFALVNVCSAASQNIIMLGATRVLAALCAGLFAPGAAASASGMVPPGRRGRALAIVLGGTSLSTVLGVPLGLYVAELTSWRGAFLFVAALAVLAAIGIAALLPAVEPPPRIALGERLALLRRPDILSILLVTVCANAGGFSVYTYLAPLFQGVGDAGTVRILIFVFGLAAVCGGYLAGHGSDTWGATRVLTGSLVVFTINHFLLAYWADAFTTSVLYMVIWGVAGWGTVPPQQHRLVHAAGPAAGIAISLNASAIYLGIGLGGLLGGYVVQTAGADHLWLSAGCGGALALLLVPLSVAAERRTAAARERTTEATAAS
ncbi:MAG TPA: MFS transporter [Streptosporangiaceae bacterium]|jgi:predicted MFS family arabinose efflux permease